MEVYMSENNPNELAQARASATLNSLPELQGSPSELEEAEVARWKEIEKQQGVIRSLEATKRYDEQQSLKFPMLPNPNPDIDDSIATAREVLQSMFLQTDASYWLERQRMTNRLMLGALIRDIEQKIEKSPERIEELTPRLEELREELRLNLGNPTEENNEENDE